MPEQPDEHPHVVAKFYPDARAWHADEWRDGDRYRHVYLLSAARGDGSGGYSLVRFDPDLGAVTVKRASITAAEFLAIVAAIHPSQQRSRSDDHLGVPEPAGRDGGVPDPPGRDEPLPGSVGQLRRPGVSGRGAMPDRHNHSFSHGLTGRRITDAHSHTNATWGHEHPEMGYGPAYLDRGAHLLD